MQSLNLFTNNKADKSKKQQKSNPRGSSPHTPIPAFGARKVNGVATPNSMVSIYAEAIEEFEHILEYATKTRYSEQDVHLSISQELDLELAKLTGLLIRGERHRLESQDCSIQH
ncbi:hypothetical protein K493DRAFT_320088, partial [Basidiobolus meristosporus CBS 931.73]